MWTEMRSSTQDVDLQMVPVPSHCHQVCDVCVLKFGTRTSHDLAFDSSCGQEHGQRIGDVQAWAGVVRDPHLCLTTDLLCLHCVCECHAAAPHCHGSCLVCSDWGGHGVVAGKKAVCGSLHGRCSCLLHPRRPPRPRHSRCALWVAGGGGNGGYLDVGGAWVG